MPDMETVLQGAETIRVGIKLLHLCRIHKEWSIKTFGTVEEKGPLGPLEHMGKEVYEARDAYKEYEEAVSMGIIVGEHGASKLKCDYKTELADCLLLLLDSVTRSGFDIEQLIEAATAKMAINEKRVYRRGPDPNKPVEHDRSLDHDSVNDAKVGGV